MASLCDMRYNKRVSQIDVASKELYLADGSVLPYDRLISTLPLNKMMQMTGLHVSAQEDPHTSVLVLNIGALRGPNCPDDHWLYNPDAKSGFHRVGFYSNVDRSFLPAAARPRNEAVSIYIERAFVGGQTLTQQEVGDYSKAVVEELQEWGYITEAEVVDPTWIDVAYTWSYPNSRWQQQAIKKLEDNNVYQIGRYGRWIFQGIADSIRDGFFAGSSFKYTGAPEIQVRAEVTAARTTPLRKVAANRPSQPEVATRKASAGIAGAG
jgi:protoporphyrinogen oxidase